MIIGTFNGWNIIGPPASPAPSHIEWTADDTIGEVESPYNNQAQQQDWMADRWLGTVVLPPMPQAVAQPWIGFLAELRGKLNVFPLGDPLGSAPSGQANGAPVCDGVNLARSRVLNTRGWRPGTQGQLLIGDYLQIGQRLHLVIGANVDSDSEGKASIAIWPCIREAPNDGDPVTLANCAGLFRLVQNKRKWAISTTKMYGISFDVREALGGSPVQLG